ncbi:hypothetical protein E1B28_002149 [Marasmius oreades]|uniref:BHLH domain-containing protein n=1 Tax=Marasmius oreades TaxID=181124 RepID=A0A9P7RNK3_9AGAR|nr:uncharacterized protein E1B28_002149 [Marasmius oreades]KAG7086188.1 hypothetical protein E1B28_002149 [Marasmius oreades]
MTLPIVIPSPPSATASASSPSSDGSSSGPRTPLSPTHVPSLPTLPNTVADNSASGSSGKRKPSRRANTAERRATHNAVERARRETLNGRFLDLAKMLPNLSQIRRPSKSAIVNSSIAHIHASRRHRALAARELRMLKLEADHLRRELNEWRDRASIPRVEEPIRNEGFSMVLNQELEVIPVVTNGALDDDDDTIGLYGEENGSVEGNDDEMWLSSGGPIGIEEQQRMMLAAGGRISPPPMNTSMTYTQSQRPPFPHHPHSHPLIVPAHGSYDGYPDYPGAGIYSASPNEKYPNPQMQQYLESLNIARRRSQTGRDRSNSMASMTSSGSASPPLYPSHPHVHPPQFPEGGWVGAGLSHHQTMQMGGGGGIGNGVSFAMM